MLMVRLIIGLQILDIVHKHPSDHPELNSYHIMLKAAFNDLTKGIAEDISIFEYPFENTLTTEKLLDDVKRIVHAKQFSETISYYIGILELVEKFLCHYLQVLQLLSEHYIPAYSKIVNNLQVTPEENYQWILNELTELKTLIPNVTPKLVNVLDIMKSEKLNNIHTLIRQYVFMHWPDILTKLTKAAVTKDLFQKLLKQTNLAEPFQIVLDTPVQVQKLLDACIDLDVNISQLKGSKDWRLAVRARELVVAAPTLFHHAGTRQTTFRSWYEAHTSKTLTENERKDYETGLEAIFSYEVTNQVIEPDFAQHDTPLIRHRKAVQVKLTQYDSRSSSLSSGHRLMDSIMIRDSSANTVQARVFQSSSDSIEEESFQITARNPKVAEICSQQFRQYLKTQKLERTKQIELQYIELPNRQSLRFFYDAICAKFQSLYVGYLALASGKVQANLNVNGMVGSFLKVVGTALGPFGGFVFNAIGTVIQLVSQRRTVMDATKIQYLGNQQEIYEVIERYARYLTMQYEIQIRLLESVEFYQESKDDDGILAAVRGFFSRSREELKTAKVTSFDDTPQAMLADYVIAMIFGNLLLSEKMPRKPQEFAEFLSTMLINGPLLALDHDQQFFNAIGFYKFGVYHTDQKWHAVDIFKAPRIAVHQDNGEIEYWQSPKGANTHYFSRIGTREEAIAAKYILQGSEALTASQEIRRN